MFSVTWNSTEDKTDPMRKMQDPEMKCDSQDQSATQNDHEVV